MKKILYISFIFCCFMLFCNKIQSKNDKIATCVYDASSVLNENAPSKIIINVDLDYKITFDYFEYQEKWGDCSSKEGWKLRYDTVFNDEHRQTYICDDGYYPKTQVVVYDFVYGNFIKDTVFSCENISTLYYNNDLNVGQVTLTHTIKKSSADSKRNYKLNSKESVVNVSNPTDQEDESGWLKVCHYNNVTLKFNKEKYEIINAHPIKKQYPLEKGNLMEYLSKNKYSCPFKYCFFSSNGGTEDIDGNIVYGNIGYFINNEADYISGRTCYYSADYSGDEFICGALLSYMKDFDKYNKEYQKNGEVEQKTLMNKTEKNIKEFCRMALANSNYNDPDNCAKECISINEILEERKEKENNTTSQCGFSGELILIIANIVKWAKYIVPVLVIVLGILDFIKAIANNKDDEMKKAQGHFVKRLIAAGLIFIVPFIIEFILDKMGFDANGCGIIDL